MKNGIPIRASLGVLVLATALPFVALIAYNTYSQAQDEAEHAGAEALRAARATAAEAETTLRRTRELLSYLSEQPVVRSLDPKRCDLVFTLFSRLFPQYTNLVTVHRNGDRVCSAVPPPPGAPAKVDPQFFLAETVRSRAFTVGQVIRGVFTGRWILAVAYPVVDEQGEIRGVVSVPVDLARLQLMPRPAELPPQSVARIVDAKGTVIGSSVAPEKWIGQNFSEVPWFKLLEPGRAATGRTADVDGGERIFGAVPIDGTTWHAAVGIPVDVVYGPVRHRLMLNAAISLVALLLVAALGYLIARRIARPVEAIAAAAREATRSASGRVLVQPTASSAPREIQMLAGDFRAMLKARIDAEVELREGEAGLRRAQTMAQLAHVVTGPDGSFESWSETLPQLIGTAVPKGTREWLALLHPEDREAFRATSIEAAVKGSRGFVEYRLRRPDGEWIHVRQVMEPMPARESDGLTRWFSTLQNITAQKRAAEAMRRSESLKSAILESSLDCLVTMDHNGNAVEFNPAAEATFGFRREEVLGKSIADLIIPPRFRDAHRRGLAHYLKTGGAGVLGRRLELYAVRADGTEFPVELAITPVKSGSAPMFTASIRDITQRKRAEAERIASEQALRESEVGLKRLNRVYAVLSGINSLIVRVQDRQELFRESCRLAVDAGGFVASWIAVVDREAMRLKPVAWQGGGQDYIDLMPLALNETDPMYGLPGQAFVARRAMVVEDMATDSRILLKEEALKRGFHSLVMLPLIVAGEPFGVLALYAVEIGFFDEGEMKLLLELAADISFALEHLAKTDKLEYLAHHDSLTGLANRTLLMDRLTQAVATASREQRKLALVITDIERFKIINDTLGRQAGDALLKQMAERLTQLAGDSNRIARISGDHFAVMIPEVADEAKVARIIEDGGARVEGEPFTVGGTELRVAVRSGIAMFPNDGTEADMLFKNAEAALKNAKASGDKYLFYTQQMTERVAGKLSLENKLRLALENEQFVLHYQPKVELESRRIVGLEALIRWLSPELGLVPPMKFIPLLEETGLILPVGSWALKRASLDHRAWVEQGLNPPRVAVNVSAIQLRQRDFVVVVEGAIIDGVAPTGIDLEITESLIMEDIQRNIEKLNSVRGLGVNIAIDDFGTGYSSLAYLARLPVETLKIDRSFIVTMLNDPNTMTLVRTMISLAHSLHLKVVAEGVETEEQANVLRLLRCDQMQGYLFSKPLALEEITALLKSRS